MSPSPFLPYLLKLKRKEEEIFPCALPYHECIWVGNWPVATSILVLSARWR
jgi:hypothetical protein